MSNADANKSSIIAQFTNALYNRIYMICVRLLFVCLKSFRAKRAQMYSPNNIGDGFLQ